MKPKYHLLNNTKYALNGIKSMLIRESSFKLEIACIMPLLIFSFFLDVSSITHLILVFSLLFILVVESLNSAIEACVDLITDDFHNLAKIAKDCASSAVFFSIANAVIIWTYVLYDVFKAKIY